MNSGIITELLNKRDFWQIEIPVRYARAFGVVSFILLICLGAHLKLYMPANPVPITLQTLFVLMAGAMLGARYGTLAVISYIFLGALGFPMFAPGGAIGLLCLIGPTGGYLVGFVLAAASVGYITQNSNNSVYLALALITGEIVILTLGCVHLGFITGMGLKSAFAIGVLPFIAGDLIKVAAAWVIISMTGKARNMLRD